MPDEALFALREAGRIASAARALGVGQMGPGVLVRDVCHAVEDEIRRRGGELAFPTQCSRNDVAAHDCPAPEDESRYAAGDLAKLDLGVHVDGWVVDTAVTVNLGDAPENRPLVEAAEAALRAAIAVAGPGVPIVRLSRAIAAAIEERGLRPIRNLCGHHVGRYTVHAPPPVPNTPGTSLDRLAPGAVLAIEPFATDGSGIATERGVAEVFRVVPGALEGLGLDPGVLEVLRAKRGLPFSRRDLGALPRDTVAEALALLARAGVLAAYPPLVEATGGRVAQAEHSLYVGRDGIEVLTL